MTPDQHQNYLKAITNGFQAGIDGLDPRLCPYDKLTREWGAWVRWHELGIRYAHGEDVDEPPYSGCIASHLGTHQ